MPSDATTEVLARGLDQLETLLRAVGPEDLGRSTPCSDWTVSDLVDHVVQTPGKFAAMVRAEDVDWAAPTPRAHDPVATYQEHARALRAALAENPDPQPGIDWQCAELAVHTWDLATALGRSTATLDPEVAEHGRAFMLASLTDDIRAPRSVRSCRRRRGPTTTPGSPPSPAARSERLRGIASLSLLAADQRCARTAR